MKLEIEYQFSGPLAHVGTRRLLEDAVYNSTTLEECYRSCLSINGIAIYRGGKHIAIHPSSPEGFIADGSARIAIITEGGPNP